MPRKRRAWSIPEWRAFGIRCQAIRDRLRLYTHRAGTVPGIRAPISDALLRDQSRFHIAMMAVENVIAKRYPELNFVVAGIVHGPNGSPPLDPHPPSWTAPLTRDEWASLGQEYKALRLDIAALGVALEETAATAAARKFFRVSNESKARCLLDALVCRQYPAWLDATHVFYGPRVPHLLTLDSLTAACS